MTDQKNTVNTLKAKNERNLGIDILRIISMFMVTVLHLAGQGGYKGTPDSGAVYYIMTFLVVVCYGAVNIFALISGYVMYGTSIKYKRIVGLWFQVAFYSVGLSIIDKVVFHSTDMFIKSLLPVLSAKYWYFSAYFFMFFFIPYFNSFIEKLSGKTALKFIVTGSVILSVISNIVEFTGYDIIGLLKGYSLMWLSFCYLIGALIKKYRRYFERLSSKTCIWIIFACTALTFIDSTWLVNMKLPANLEILPRGMLLRYTSPTVFVMSVCMLIIFSRIKISHGKKLIGILSATSFGVYIVQTHSLIWNNYILKFSTFFNVSNALSKTLLVLVGAVGLYILISIADYLRIQLFRLLHIDSLSAWICKLLERILKIVEKPFVKYTEP